MNELKGDLVAAENEINLLNSQLNYKKSTENNNLCDLDILGYEIHPSSHELRKRYKNLASIYHPDKGGSKVMMQRLNDAYEKLRRKVA
ncbi:hypothetical protein A130_18840 [Vibrio genomosp. F6 str. FF-238]|uniref:J domain-containing protein n=1 Tax=Vibrio genomosp. F6 str. FF-238 TaxID=1191298 RepID=A0A1E5CQ22_9VIBR|nr:hypothetical protein A130_18840 [Vibrio genomosp. F6 str. FF-238]